MKALISAFNLGECPSRGLLCNCEGSFEALSFMLLSGGFVLPEILGPLLSSSSGASEGDWSRAAALGSTVLPGEAQGEE